MNKKINKYKKLDKILHTTFRDIINLLKQLREEITSLVELSEENYMKK